MGGGPEDAVLDAEVLGAVAYDRLLGGKSHGRHFGRRGVGWRGELEEFGLEWMAIKYCFRRSS